MRKLKSLLKSKGYKLYNPVHLFKLFIKGFIFICKYRFNSCSVLKAGFFNNTEEKQEQGTDILTEECPCNKICNYRICYMLHHPVHLCKGKQFGSVTETGFLPDTSLSERISKAYKKLIEEQRQMGDGQWAYINTLKSDVHDALLGDDMAKLAEMLANPISNDLLYGFDDIYKSKHLIDKNITFKKNQCWSLFMRLGEAWGAGRAQYPPAFRVSTTYEYPEPSVVLNKLNEIFSCNIEFPNPYYGEIGVMFNTGIANFRAINALHQAMLIYDKLGRKTGRVLEIGAGMGRTAYFAKKLFSIDYIIIDLPLTAVASAHFLGRTLGSDAVALYGEPPISGAIQILPPESFLSGSLGRFDLILNCDSLTEMDYDTMSAYWNRIKTDTAAFLSINHEYNTYTVRELMLNDINNNIKTYTRTQYWMRNGYVEEYVTF